MLKTIFHRLKRFIGLWPGITWAIVPMLVVAFGTDSVLRAIDPTVEPISMGMLQVVVIVIVIVMLLNEAAFGAVKFNFKTLFNYYSGGFIVKFSDDFKSLTPWQRILVLLFAFSLYFLAMLLFVAKMLGSA